jgi:hypothetical protein
MAKRHGEKEMMRRPDYCDDTFNDRGDGFFFSSPPPKELFDRANLGDKNGWVALCCALGRLIQGDFNVFAPLMEAMTRTEDADYWNACGLLLSFAAPWSELRKLSRLFPVEALQSSSEFVRLYCKILTHSMAPWAVDEVLRWYTETRDEEVRVLVADYLSHVLEDEPSVVANGPQMKTALEPPPPFEEQYYDYDEYISAVRMIRDRVVAQSAGRMGTPLLGGRPFSAVELARRIIKHAQMGENSPRTNFERMAFEGASGIPCRDFFQQPEQLKVRPLSAAATAEMFLKSKASATFADGVRYFFGHPIPQ